MILYILIGFFIGFLFVNTMSNEERIEKLEKKWIDNNKKLKN